MTWEEEEKGKYKNAEEEEAKGGIKKKMQRQIMKDIEEEKAIMNK